MNTSGAGETREHMAAVAKAGLEPSSYEAVPGIVGSTIPKRVFPSGVNSNIISRHQLTEHRPRLPGVDGKIRIGSGSSAAIGYRKGKTDSADPTKIGKDLIKV